MGLMRCKQRDENRSKRRHDADLKKKIARAKGSDVGIDDAKTGKGGIEQAVSEKTRNRCSKLRHRKHGGSAKNSIGFELRQNAMHKRSIACHNRSVPVTAPLLPISSSRGDEEIKSLLRKHKISLSVEEARKVTELLGRDPTIVEATIFGIQGSEHCSYKSSRRFLKTLPTEGKHVILGPKEDSGIVALTDGPKGKRWGIVVSHESHNKPSQVVPFEGAATGVGGCVRDVFCMGARVIGSMDMLRLGDLSTPETRTIAREVARGIAGYGNPLGVPNFGGDTFFDAGFNRQCLVNVVALGIVREDEVIRSTVPEEAGREGYDIILVGKPTDRSGFGGAAFASASLEKEKHEQNTGAVQEPNPFLERHLLASTYALFDWLAETKQLHRVSFKDLGAGGVVCASVEQVAGRNFGARISLDNVHTALPDLPAEVIACAETQERMCWICHPDLTEHILHHYNVTWDLPSIAENARANVIGSVTQDDIYELTRKGQVVCAAASQALTSGFQYVRPTESTEGTHSEPSIECIGEKISVRSPQKFSTTISDVFRAMVSHPNYASKAAIIRHYDKTVIGNSVIEAGEADAGVAMPLRDIEAYVEGNAHPSWKLSEEDALRAAAFGSGGNARYGRASPYWQGAHAALEAMMNVAAVGATPRALTDCLNYGNPEIPSHLSALKEGVEGITAAAKGVAIDGEPVPVISGNVSLYNATPEGVSVPPSAIVCAIGVVENGLKAVSMQLKNVGDEMLLLGEIADECGASAYYEILERMSDAPYDSMLGAKVPKPDFDLAGRLMTFTVRAVQNGLLSASHDISEGGMLLSLFDMLLPQRKIGGHLGLKINLGTLGLTLRSDTLLFSQTPAFIVASAPKSRLALEAIAKELSVPLRVIGTVIDTPTISILRGTEKILELSTAPLFDSWQNGLKNALREPSH